jgi:hypothetical protein
MPHTLRDDEGVAADRDGNMVMPTWETPVLATDVIRRDHDSSRRPAVVDVKPAEQARDPDRLGRVDVQDGIRRHALSQSPGAVGSR